jgi:hypothetical protein
MDERVALLNKYASLNAFLWNPTRRTMTLRCSAYVEEAEGHVARTSRLASDP